MLSCKDHGGLEQVHLGKCGTGWCDRRLQLSGDKGCGGNRVSRGRQGR